MELLQPDHVLCGALALVVVFVFLLDCLLEAPVNIINAVSDDHPNVVRGDKGGANHTWEERMRKAVTPSPQIYLPFWQKQIRYWLFNKSLQSFPPLSPIGQEEVMSAITCLARNHRGEVSNVSLP